MPGSKSDVDLDAEIAHHVALLKYHDTGAPEFEERMRRFARLHVDLVPASGSAETIQGEVIRAVNRLAGEERRNGSANWHDGDYYKDLAKFLVAILPDTRVFDEGARDRIALDVQAVLDHGSGGNSPGIDVVFGRLLEDAVAYCEALPELVPLPK